VALRDPILDAIEQWWQGPDYVYSVKARVRQFGGVVQKRLAGDFARAGVPYPPAAVTLVVIKETKRLEVYAAGKGQEFRFIRAYPILGASGVLGPKLREGDRQVPEGLYAVENLNPNSSFHLALRVNYPNAFDLEKAAAEGRAEPGSDIMIHGSNCSIGCVAMGDEVAEDLFVLAAVTGVEKVKLIFSPVDFRVKEFAAPEGSPKWVPELYAGIAEAMRRYPSATGGEK